MLLFLMIILMEQKASGNCLNKTIERVNEGLTLLTKAADQVDGEKL